MAVYFQTHAGLFSGEAVAAVADKRIRVRRFILTSSINQSVTLKQDVGGASDAAICCTLYARSGGSAIDLRFDESQPQTGAGLSLGYTADAAGDYAVWIEYDVVD